MARRDVFPDIVRPDRKLPVAAVNQDGQLDRAGTAEVEDRFNGCPGCAAGIDHIVHKDDNLAVEVAWNTAEPGLRHVAQFGQIVPVEGDIDTADRDVLFAEAVQVVPQYGRKGHTAAVDTQKDKPLRSAVLFNRPAKKSD